MPVLVFFAFLAGIVTILSPCILPILPVVLSGSLGGGRKRPLGVMIGFIGSFTFFTLFLSSLVRVLGVSPDLLRWIAIVVIFFFGLSLVIPGFQKLTEQIFSRLAVFSPAGTRTGFGGGLALGLSIGLLWTPCVGPILASVIALSFTGTITGSAVFITLAYAIGTGLPMLAVIIFGRSLLQNHPGLVKNSPVIQRCFGVLMVIMAFGLFFNLDRNFQTFILKTFPGYGTGLTAIEDNSSVKKALGDIRVTPAPSSRLSDLGLAPEIIPGGSWFNSPPLTIKQLRGKVVLVDFWTYTCINCIRTLPYIENWYQKYSPAGLVIIGVHTPEFEFEKNPGNVAKAISDFGLTYPVVQDNNYSTWEAYSNHYWPAKYFIDAAGHLRFTHFGEGEYDQSEAVIRSLLAEAGASSSGQIDNPGYKIYSQTPELYLGKARSVSGYFSLTGDWQVTAQYAQTTANSGLSLDFNAKNVFLVMAPAAAQSGQVRVFLDGKLINTVTVDSDRLYDLVKLDSPGAHTLRLEFSGSAVQLFAFTFG